MRDFDADFYRRETERVRSMSIAEAIEILKHAGVLDADGRLAERYRPDRDRGAAAQDASSQR